MSHTSDSHPSTCFTIVQGCVGGCCWVVGARLLGLLLGRLCIEAPEAGNSVADIGDATGPQVA